MTTVRYVGQKGERGGPQETRCYGVTFPLDEDVSIDALEPEQRDILIKKLSGNDHFVVKANGSAETWIDRPAEDLFAVIDATERLAALREIGDAFDPPIKIPPSTVEAAKEHLKAKIAERD